MSERSKSSETGNEQERQREQWVQRATEAWNAAEEAYSAYLKAQIYDPSLSLAELGILKEEDLRVADSEFTTRWKEKCKELGLGDPVIDWNIRDGYGSAIVYFGDRSYFFLKRNLIIQYEHPSIYNAFAIEHPIPDGKKRSNAQIWNTQTFRLVRPASMDSSVYKVKEKIEAERLGRKVALGQEVFLNRDNREVIERGELNSYFE